MSLVQTITDLIIGLVGFSRDTSPGTEFAGVLDTTILGALILAIIATDIAFFVVWLERKLMARMMVRRGPTHVGPFGLLINVADALKLVGKELITPKASDKFGFHFSIVIMVVTAVMSLLVVPWSTWFVATAPNAGLLLIFAIFSLYPIAVLVAGWSSNNKYSLIGGFRSAAQLISYEVPYMISILGVLILANWTLDPVNRTFSFITIANAQTGGNVWFVFLLPIGAVVAFTAMLGETERVPFDLPEAESELVMGWRTEYSAGNFVLIMAIEYFHVFVNAAIMVILFWGGWHMPFGGQGELLGFFDPAIWFFIKVHVVIGVMIWIRAALPRVRIDQFLHIGWTRLLPMGVLNLFWAVGLGFLFYKSDLGVDQVSLAAVLLVVVVLVSFIAAVVTMKGRKPSVHMVEGGEG